MSHCVVKVVVEAIGSLDQKGKGYDENEGSDTHYFSLCSCSDFCGFLGGWTNVSLMVSTQSLEKQGLVSSWVRIREKSFVCDTTDSSTNRVAKENFPARRSHG